MQKKAFVRRDMAIFNGIVPVSVDCSSDYIVVFFEQ